MRVVLTAFILSSAIGCSQDSASILTKGMPLQEALDAVENRGLRAEEVEEAIDIREASEFRQFLIRPRQSADALYFIAIPGPDESEWVLYDIYWYEGWVKDRGKPKMERQGRQRHTDRLDLSEIL